jgi:acetyl-CoA synthetase
VAVLLSQSPQLPIAHIATYKLGAVVVPLFTLFGEERLMTRGTSTSSGGMTM